MKSVYDKGGHWLCAVFIKPGEVTVEFTPSDVATFEDKQSLQDLIYILLEAVKDLPDRCTR